MSFKERHLPSAVGARFKTQNNTFRSDAMSRAGQGAHVTLASHAPSFTLVVGGWSLERLGESSSTPTALKRAQRVLMVSVGGFGDERRNVPAHFEPYGGELAVVVRASAPWLGLGIAGRGERPLTDFALVNIPPDSTLAPRLVLPS